MKQTMNRLTTTVSVAFATVMSACSTMPPFDPEVQGYWQSDNYGWVMHVRERSIGLYDQLNGECLQSDILPLFVDIESLPNEFTLDQGELLTTLNGVKNPAIRWQKRESLAQACPNGEIVRRGETGYQQDILRDYDWYVAAFKRHYAFSDLRNLDIESQFEAGRASIEANPTFDTLVDVLDGFISETQDGHVKLIKLDYDNGETDELANGDIEATLEGALALEGIRKGESDIEGYASGQVAIILDSIRQHLDMDLRKSDSGGVLHWVPVTGQNQGYVLIEGMEEFGGESLTLDEQSAALKLALDELIADFASKDRIIIDNRLNGGGFDRLGYEIAQRFMTKDFTKLNKEVFLEGSWANVASITFRPDQTSYSGEVVLLNSPFTASAAETFAIVMADQPNVRVMGERTAGELSDMLFKTMPNGLVFSLSNESYKNEANELFEFVGIPVDIQATSFSEAQRANQQDNTLASAIALPLQ